MNQDKLTRQFFKVGDKVIINDETKLYGKVIQILPDFDIIVEVEVNTFQFELRRYSKRGYLRSLNIITGEFSLEIGIFPACVHEDLYLTIGLFFNEQLEKKVYEQD